MPDQPLAYSVADVMRLLGLSKPTVHRRIKDGTLPSLLVGGRRLIPADAVHALVDDLRGGDAA